MKAFVRDLKRRGVSGRVRDQIVIHFTKIKDGKPMFTLANGVWAGISRYMALEDSTLEGDPVTGDGPDVRCLFLLADQLSFTAA